MRVQKGSEPNDRKSLFVLRSETDQPSDPNRKSIMKETASDQSLAAAGETQDTAPNAVNMILIYI